MTFPRKVLAASESPHVKGRGRPALRPALCLGKNIRTCPRLLEVSPTRQTPKFCAIFVFWHRNIWSGCPLLLTGSNKHDFSII